MRVTAGGKLVVLGEYHVLDAGGRALVAGVEPGLVVTLAPAQRFELDCPDVGVMGLRGDVDEHGRLSWDSVTPEQRSEVRFAEMALALALAVGRRRSPGVGPSSLRVESQLGAGSDKAGLGGSAAVVAAVAAGVLAWHGCDVAEGEDRDLLLRVALAAHFVAQGGRGSGVDVAAAIAGGLARYRNPGLPRLLGAETEIASLATRVGETWSELELRAQAWPRDHVLLAGATGHGSSTRALLRRFDALEGDAALRYRELREGLGRILESAHDALSLGEAMHAHQRELERFDRELGGAGILTPETVRLVEIARALGAAAKISGAGGGDSVIALVAAGQAEALERSWGDAGFEVRLLDHAAPSLIVQS